MNLQREKRAILKIFMIALLLFLAGQGLEQLFLRCNDTQTEALCRWDCGWYRSIAVGGYDLKPHGHEKGDAANWAFFPLFPLSAGLLSATELVSVDLALILTGKLFFFTAVFSFILFAGEWRPGLSPWIAGSVAAFNPYGIYGNTGYSESLFMTLTCLSLYFLKRDRFILSGLLGGFLTGTRPVGGSIGFAYLLRAVRRWRCFKNRTAILLGLCLVPAGLAAFMLFLHFRMGDALAFMHLQFAAWNHELSNPLYHLWRVFDRTSVSAAAGISLAVAFPAMAWLAISRHYELLTFTLFATFIPLCANLIAMPRYIWWQAPVLFAVATAINHKKWTLWLYLVLSLCFSYVVYTAWINGDTWVI
ncbi:MAG: hypothetical protein JW793_04290 [Acidobacteria bacterium]|nr:hypothetical protein [Acidobacteriota bacterium]